ncbi:MAG: methyl-accepting chemotaxis protein [Ruminococcus sp.]|jgi:methyl-accepting chemotaxis protein|nr:methyl-accepting chemotaxis protein [Ruminococcus sp.]
MKNLKIAPRLIVSFLIVALFTLILGVVGIISSITLSDEVSAMYDEPVTAINAVSTIRGSFSNLRLDTLELARKADDKNAVKDYKSAINAFDTEIQNSLKDYDATITNMSLESAYKKFKEAYPKYLTDIQKVIESAEKDGSKAALEAFDKYDKAAEDIIDIVDDIAAYNVEIAADLDALSDNTALTVIIIQITVIIFAIAAAILIAITTANAISKPVNYITKILRAIGKDGRTTFTESEWAEQKRIISGKDETAECADYLGYVARALNGVAGILTRVSEGDLTIEHTAMSDDDVISKAVIKMIDSLNSMFGDINQAAEQVSLGANQISDAAQSLAEGSTEQAATVEELSASIADVSEKTKNNAERAADAANLSVTIKTNAEKGNNQMAEMTQAVTEINQASQDISKVIKVIDDIAFQTNILALNAAVEAARAGEAGKGFAVVADEVRNLASKSAAAAKETGALIENSMKKAELGTAIAAQTANSLSEIVAGINKSSDLITDIAQSSESQSIAISQINDGISQVSEVVQKNSAVAEESAASAEELNAQSEVLQGHISQFKLKK